MKVNIHFVSHVAQYSLEREMFQTNGVEEIKTHILCSVFFFRKSCRFLDSGENYCMGAGHR